MLFSYFEKNCFSFMKVSRVSKFDILLFVTDDMEHGHVANRGYNESSSGLNEQIQGNILKTVTKEKKALT